MKNRMRLLGLMTVVSGMLLMMVPASGLIATAGNQPEHQPQPEQTDLERQTFFVA